MVLWCKCGAFMGVRQPLSDWSVELMGMCPSCTPMAPGVEEMAEKAERIEMSTEGVAYAETC